MDAVPVCDGNRRSGYFKGFFLFSLVEAKALIAADRFSTRKKLLRGTWRIKQGMLRKAMLGARNPRFINLLEHPDLRG
jgi:hypothetical protein